MSKRPKSERDPNLIAYKVAKAATEGESEPNPSPQKKNPHAVALGRLGGLKGGKARAKKLSKTERSAIARKGAEVRWRNKR